MVMFQQIIFLVLLLRLMFCSFFIASGALFQAVTPSFKKVDLIVSEPRFTKSEAGVGLRWPSSLERQLSRSWMRKVVGSNPSDAKLDHRFSFVEESFEKRRLALIEKRRLFKANRRNDNNAKPGNNNNASQSKRLFESTFFESTFFEWMWPHLVILLILM